MIENTMIAEQARLATRHRLQILDTDSEPPFDHVVRMVANLFGMPSVGIHLLDDERQWVKAFESQPFSCPREESVCQFAVAHDDLLVIPDLREDSRTRDLGIVTGEPHVRFCACMPLRTSEGHAVGTLRLIDFTPRPELDAGEVRWLRQFADLVTKIMEVRVEHHRSQQDLFKAMEFDAVTGLRNQASILREGQRLLDAMLGSGIVAVVKIRLDRMELLVGATGQTGGSDTLRVVAERLGTMVGPDDLLGRGNGDTFLIVRVSQVALDDDQLKSWLDATASQVLTRLAEPMTIAGQRVDITASIGLAAFTDNSPVHIVVDAAGAASLASQDNGGNQARHFTPEVWIHFRERVTIEADLREAVANYALSVHYQPIVDISQGGLVVGAEALARWPRGDKCVVGPDQFIPIAERLGLIHDLGLQVFGTACRDLAAWLSQGQDLWISVNLSPPQLDDPQLVDKLTECARVAGVDCARIKLEITESGLSLHLNEVDHMLRQLREAGFLLVLDDFGTGNSSLARMIRMPFDTIKVDRGFVSDCPAGLGAAVVMSVSSLARHLGMKLVAEGVEHEAHERFVREHGYTLAQGYYYARPMPAEALTNLFAASTAAESLQKQL